MPSLMKIHLAEETWEGLFTLENDSNSVALYSFAL